MSRDFFVSLAVGIGCHKCETPSVDDIIKYQISPFIDLPKTNRYYYCIAYAAENNIAQWYIPNETGKAYCENKKEYMSSPFCAENSISRIEAAAILLRRAKLWDDSLNAKNTNQTISILDVTSYWYGYAKKWIDIGIIKQKSDNTIGQDEKITRGEFAIMAARMLQYTQCQTDDITNSLESEIQIQDSKKKIIEKTYFNLGEDFMLVPLTSTGNWNYRWQAINTKTKATLSGTGNILPGSQFGEGNWIVKLEILDPKNGNVVSNPHTTLSIGNNAKNDLSVIIDANPLVANIWQKINFSSIINGGDNSLLYNWDFGDGTTWSEKNNTSHIYQEGWVYKVTLTITDPKTGTTAQSAIIVRITGERDTDGDGILDSSDVCPTIYARTPDGCPIVYTYNPNNTKENTNTTTNNTNSLEAQIGIRNSENVQIQKSIFNKWENFSLFPITSTGSWEYNWIAVSQTSWTVLSGSTNIFPGSQFDTGDWKVSINIIDPNTKKVLSSPNATIQIIDTSTNANNLIPCVVLSANPLSTTTDTPVDFTSTTCSGNTDLVYNWDFGDGMTFPTGKNNTHIYKNPWVYTVILTVKDPNTGKTWQSTVIITVWWKPNSNDYSFTTGNICLDTKRKVQWLLIGTPNCTQCPCNNTIEIDSSLRSCDIVFPTILSPDRNTVYSRGWFFLIP